MAFRTVDGILVPAVTAEQMREVDRVAMEDFGLGILQMMENAGRSLAQNVMDMLDGVRSEVTVMAGSGGNVGISFEPFFERRYWIPLVVEGSS